MNDIIGKILLVDSHCLYVKDYTETKQNIRFKTPISISDLRKLTKHFNGVKQKFKISPTAITVELKNCYAHLKIARSPKAKKNARG